MPADRNVVQKEAEKKLKYKSLYKKIQRNVEPEMYDCTSDNWSHWNSNEKLKEKFGSCTGKTFDRFTTKDSYTWNITHNTESTAVWNLKLVQEKYQEEKACDKRHPYRVIIITITTTVIIFLSSVRPMVCWYSQCPSLSWTPHISSTVVFVSSTVSPPCRSEEPCEPNDCEGQAGGSLSSC